MKLIVLLHPLKELQKQLNASKVKVECVGYYNCLWLFEPQYFFLIQF